MKCRWEATERQLFVRTVWVRSISQAILTREEVSKKKDRSGSAKSEPSQRGDPELAERVCKLLRGRAVTPYRGTLWESPRQETLDVRSSRALLSLKTPGPGPTSSSVTAKSPSPTPPSPSPSPPLVLEYARPPPASAPAVITRAPIVRPKLHIFMPDTRKTTSSGMPQFNRIEDSPRFRKAVADVLVLDKQFQC